MNTYFEIIDESQLLPCPSTFQPSPIHTKPNNNNNTDTNPSSSLHDELEILISASLHKKRKGGRKKFQETRHPIYRGVRYRKGKWVCEVREPKKATRIWLGTYPTPEMAARAHDVGVLAIKGTSAILNFPNSSYDLPIIDSSSSKEIREAAKQVAEVFRPSNYYSSSLFNSNDGMKKKKRCNNSSNDKKGITTKVDDDPLIDEKIQEIVLDSSSLFMHNTTSCGDDDVVNSNDDSGLGEKNNDDSDQNNDQLNRSAAAGTMLLDDEATLFNMRDCWDWDWDGIMEEGLCNFQMSSMQSSSNHYYSLDWDVATAASSMDFNLWTDY